MPCRHREIKKYFLKIIFKKHKKQAHISTLWLNYLYKCQHYEYVHSVLQFVKTPNNTTWLIYVPKKGKCVTYSGSQRFVIHMFQCPDFKPIPFCWYFSFWICSGSCEALWPAVCWYFPPIRNSGLHGHSSAGKAVRPGSLYNIQSVQQWKRTQSCISITKVKTQKKLLYNNIFQLGLHRSTTQLYIQWIYLGGGNYTYLWWLILLIKLFHWHGILVIYY